MEKILLLQAVINYSRKTFYNIGLRLESLFMEKRSSLFGFSLATKKKRLMMFPPGPRLADDVYALPSFEIKTRI
jgi:hypothetical protein